MTRPFSLGRCVPLRRAAAVLVFATCAQALAAPPALPPRAYLLAQQIAVSRLTSVESRESLGPPLTGVRRNLQDAEFIIAELTEAEAAAEAAPQSSLIKARELARAAEAMRRFSALRDEIDAQMNYIEALVARADLDASLAQAEQQFKQTTTVLAEAEARAAAAEAALAAQPSTSPPSSAPSDAPSPETHEAPK